MSQAHPLDRAHLQAEPLAGRLRRLVRDAAMSVGADESTIWIPDAEGSQLLGAINHGPTSKTIESLAVPVDGSEIGMVHLTNIGSCTGPADRRNPLVDAATGTKTLAMVAVPIHLGQAAVGVLSAINPKSRHVFDERDLAELEWRAYLAGLIIGDHLPGAVTGPTVME
jgi:hypothetical protein